MRAALDSSLSRLGGRSGGDESDALDAIRAFDVQFQVLVARLKPLKGAFRASWKPNPREMLDVAEEISVLARALAQSTMVIVLDEPTTGLDLRHQMELLELLKTEVADCGLTIIATLHDLTLAGQFADRLVLLDQGVVVVDGPARDVVRSRELSEHYGMNLRVIDVDGSDVIVPVRH